MCALGFGSRHQLVTTQTVFDTWVVWCIHCAGVQGGEAVAGKELWQEVSHSDRSVCDTQQRVLCVVVQDTLSVCSIVLAPIVCQPLESSIDTSALPDMIITNTRCLLDVCVCWVCVSVWPYRVKDVMTATPITVRPETGLDEAAM